MAIRTEIAELGQDELKELIGALQGMVDAPETAQKHWEPTEGEQYFYLWGTGKKDGGVFTTENQKDVMRLAVGNCFKTEEERDAAAEYLMIAAEMNMPVERVREILKISQEPVSLETPIGEEEDSHLGDFIQDDNVPVPADAAAFTLLKEQLEEVLGTLTEREQKVLTLRFGLEDGRARTLEEVGKEFNVTRERIRQIEAKALRKLRHPSRSRKLKDYLE